MKNKFEFNTKEVSKVEQQAKEEGKKLTPDIVPISVKETGNIKEAKRVEKESQNHEGSNQVTTLDDLKIEAKIIREEIKSLEDKIKDIEEEMLRDDNSIKATTLRGPLEELKKERENKIKEILEINQERKNLIMYN